MVRIEDIVSISELTSPLRYTINFRDGTYIVLKRKYSILPLLLLIQEEKVLPTEALDVKNNKILKYLWLKGVPMPRLNYRSTLSKLDMFFDDLIKRDKFTFITKRSFNGIYKYVLPREHLNDLLFKPNLSDHTTLHEQFEHIWEKQGGVCNICGMSISYDDYVVDFRVPASRGGKKVEDNVQILCKACMTNKTRNCKFCISVCDRECKMAYPEYSDIIQSIEK